MSVIQRFKNELAIDNLDFDASTAALGMLNWRETFGHSSNRCFKTRTSYLAFRIVLFLLMFATTIYSLASEKEDRSLAYWLIYLTHWGLIVECLYLGFGVYTTYSSSGWSEEKKLPKYVQIMWMLRAIILPGSFMIFAMYWGLVFDGAFEFVSALTHGLNFVVMMVDAVVGRMPYLLLHGLYFFIFSATFLVWSLIHYAAGIGDGKGNMYIYKTLDWSNPEDTGSLTSFILLIVAPIVNLIFWMVLLCANQGSTSENLRDDAKQKDSQHVDVKETASVDVVDAVDV